MFVAVVAIILIWTVSKKLSSHFGHAISHKKPRRMLAIQRYIKFCLSCFNPPIWSQFNHLERDCLILLELR